MKNNTKNLIRLGFILLGAIALGCGGAAGKSETAGGMDSAAKTTATGERVHSPKARDDFAKAAEKYKAAKVQGWSKGSCNSAADEFQDVADDYDNMPEAMYNVGAVYRECGMKKKALSAFEKVLRVYPKHQLSLTHLAVYRFEAGDIAGGQDLLRKAVSAGGNKLEVVPAYVNAATLLRKQAKDTGDDEKFGKAQTNLRRALAIDQKYMPALYQLAMLYLDTAVAKDKESFLDLAMIVCDQAVMINPEYGPIYHVRGMILLQKNDIVEALKVFQVAFEKDPALFESYMNFAAINLGFRGYESAKMAFEKAIGLQPNSYDAHIGLGVALRGLGDYQGAKAEYKKASAIQKRRVDYIFNVGILEMDYLNSGTTEGFQKAKQVFQKFVQNAGPALKKDPDGRKGPEKSWVQKAKDRIALCDKNVKQLIEAEKAMAEMERMRKENKKRQAALKAQMQKAKELEAKEAKGAVAPEEAKVSGSENSQ